MRFFYTILIILCWVGSAGAGEVAPLTAADQIVWAHAPFEMGACDICHQSGDPANPGPITGEVNDLCFSCHDMFQDTLAGFANLHNPVEEACTNCHNPHNSSYEKLLKLDTTKLCGSCHDDILEVAEGSPVRHEPVTEGRSCLNCHDPHASNVESMLTALPYDLCIGCHDKDDLTDGAGKPLTNFKTLIAHSEMEHGPVDDKDCSACHEVHGGKNFRMLMAEYPAKFYAPYDAANYELCFSCHEIDAFETERTTTLTGFRNGARNLHFLHVNKSRRGRTCRACHDVHASPQPHLIRDGVPYGPRNWILKLNYTPTETGGSCAKTCHPTRTYDRFANR